MKKILLLTFTFLISINAYTQAGLLAGTGYAPNFTVTDINGTSHTIYDYLDSGYAIMPYHILGWRWIAGFGFWFLRMFLRTMTVTGTRAAIT